MKIYLLLTGNELMTGVTVDSNSAMVAQQLMPHGLRIDRKVTVGDEMTELVEQLHQLSKECDVLIVNGGLGPTRDDLTAQALSDLTGKPLQEHPQALAHLQQWCQNRGFALNEANYKQALLPQDASIVANPVGSAVGIQLHHNDCEIICTPGVPSELKAMLEQSIVPQLQKRQPPEHGLLLTRFHTFGLGESSLQQRITEQLPDWPEQVELGFRAGLPTLEVKLQTPKTEPMLHQQWVEKLQQLIGDHIVAEEDGSLAQTLVQLLTQQGKTLTTAESCTGGMISSLITAIPGSSAVFESGYVTYANSSKQRMLGVDPQLLIDHGAVSEPVVRAMAEGALKNSGATYTIAVSGIAGPDGGSDEKPVGLVWLAWGSANKIQSASLFFPHGRAMFQPLVAGAGLDLVRRFACGIESEPRYLRERKPPTKAVN
ncbi:MAG: CinA family nicotinamide mononucleotide deamidase-related protein [Motiliproteus sp.]|nr:CinA family nicotinamide mononucleotide deamidase-related protein [Motiliproteus sp.]MCW9052756.1 CinA family nicotinamide mononucleotide deamidase-related protein [Motiliproteus sp.]